MYSLARPVLFALDAERAHDLTLDMLERMPGVAGAMVGKPRVGAPVSLLGLRFPNAVGLAAGLDKNARCLPAWDKMGFGFVEVGTVTPRPQAGNPKPRMFRLPEHGAIINRLGFNNEGVDALVARVKRDRARFGGVLGINIGKNATTPNEQAADDYVHCLQKVHALADYITVNISSPNTKNLRELQSEAALGGLLSAIRDCRRALADREGCQKPLLLKIAPDVTAEQVPVIVELCQHYAVDGLIASNTTLDRAAVQGHRFAAEAGGLSGPPVREKAQALMQSLRNIAGPDYPLIGVGGINSGVDALARKNAGAQLVQVYTGFIYQGPALVADAAKAIG